MRVRGEPAPPDTLSVELNRDRAGWWQSVWVRRVPLLAPPRRSWWRRSSTTSARPARSPTVTKRNDRGQGRAVRNLCEQGHSATELATDHGNPQSSGNRDPRPRHGGASAGDGQRLGLERPWSPVVAVLSICDARSLTVTKGGDCRQNSPHKIALSRDIWPQTGSQRGAQRPAVAADGDPRSRHGGPATGDGQHLGARATRSPVVAVPTLSVMCTRGCLPRSAPAPAIAITETIE
jgi:hypothetical protein